MTTIEGEGDKDDSDGSCHNIDNASSNVASSESEGEEEEAAELVPGQTLLSEGSNCPMGLDRVKLTRELIELRIKEVTGLEGKEKQVDAIHKVACQLSSLLLIAKTGFGKSLIFNMLPLILPDQLGAVLVIVPLKHIQNQQVDVVNRLPRARGIVLNAESNKRSIRKQISQCEFTHGSLIRALRY